MQYAFVVFFVGLATTQAISKEPTAPYQTSKPTTMITVASEVEFDMGDFYLDDLPDAVFVSVPGLISVSIPGVVSVPSSVGISISNPITLSLGVSVASPLKPRTARAPVATGD